MLIDGYVLENLKPLQKRYILLFICVIQLTGINKPFVPDPKIYNKLFNLRYF